MRFLILTILLAVTGFWIGRWLSDAGGPVPVAIQSPISTEDAVGASTPTPHPSATPAVDDNLPPRERLRSVLADPDIFRASRDAVRWLEQASLEDLREFVKEPKKFSRVYVAGFDSDFQKAFLDAFVERWLTLAPDDFKLIGTYDYQRRELAQAAARMRPEWVLGKMSEGEKGSANILARIALESLAERDVGAAREILKGFPDLADREKLEFEIIKGLAKADVFSAAAQLPLKGAQQPNGEYASAIRAIIEAAERIGPGALRRVLAEPGGKLDSYDGLPRLLLRYPDLAADYSARGAGTRDSIWLDENLLRDADRTSEEKRASMLAEYEKLPTGGREKIAAALACSWARTDPRAAADWALNHAKSEEPASSANLAAQYVFIRWLNSDPKTALAWWESLPPSAMRDVIGTEASTRVAESGDFEEAKKLFRPIVFDGPATEDFRYKQSAVLDHFAQLYAEHDPLAAAEWLAALPAGIFGQRAAEKVANAYYQRDPASVARWADQLSDRTNRDQALAQFIKDAAQHDPASAAQWVEKIADPKLRSSATVSLSFAWRNDDPAAFLEWLKSQPTMDEKLRKSFLSQ